MPNNFLFDLLAPFYDHVISPKDSDDLMDPLALPAAGWMLDVGGGTGRASARLKDAIDHMVICDLSYSMLEKAKEKGVTNLVQASSKNLPFSPETFERIMMVDALHHMNDQKGSVEEMLRTLKKGGRILIEEPDIRLFAVKLIALMEKIALMKSYFHTPDEIVEMVASFGLETQLDSDGKGSAWIIADKPAA